MRGPSGSGFSNPSRSLRDVPEESLMLTGDENIVDIALGYGDDSGDAWYVNGGSGLCNISLGGSKDIKITESYSLPVFGSFVYNPDSEAAFLVFGASF